jgi:P4 family phage/plasmid primase-like protien
MTDTTIPCIYSHCKGDIILLHTGDKRPIDLDWTMTPSRINGDARGYLALGYNLGYRIPGGVLIIDVDPRNGGLESFSALPDAVRRLPRTTNTPSGGWHIYTTLPAGYDERLLASKLPEYPGIDFLHHGRQVVMPGSSLEDGRQWHMAPGVVLPPPETPGDLLDLLSRPRFSPSSVSPALITPLELEQILSLLPVEKYRDNDSWLQVAMACHHATGGEGLTQFVAWSVADPEYSDQQSVIEARWRSMAVSPNADPITLRTLCRELALTSVCPQWLLVRAGIQQDPSGYFKQLEEDGDRAQQTFDEYLKLVEDSSSYLQLVGPVLAKIANESGLSEGVKDLLYRRIAQKTGSTLGSLRKDIKHILASASASAPPASLVTTTRNQVEDSLIDPSQVHTVAARSALLSLQGSDEVAPVFCNEVWYRWDRTKWGPSDNRREIERHIYKALYSLGVHATASTVQNVARLMEILQSIPGSSFDPAEDKIIVYTRTKRLTLGDGKWKEDGHSPEHKNVTTINADLVESPAPVTWNRYLEEAVPSEKGRRAVHCALIYTAAVSRPWLRKAVYLFGPKRSGKSKMLNLVESVIGRNNCSSLSMRQIGSQFGPSTLVGKLANISNEMLTRETVQDDIFKALVSGESINVERKNEQSFPYRNSAILWFGANVFPRVEDESDATWDRFTIISCPNSVPEHKADTLLDEKLFAERDHIFTQALRIFTEEYERDKCISALGDDSGSQDILDRWIEVNSPPTRWIGERLNQAEVSTVRLSDAYQDYTQWCNYNGHKRQNRPHWEREIKKRTLLIRVGSDSEGERALLGVVLRPWDVKYIMK